MSFVAAVPTAKKDAYIAHSTAAAAIFKECGATRVVEAWGEMILPGEVTSFPMAVQAQQGETVVTGWQEWPDAATAHACMESMESDPRFAALGDLPFDGKRMIFGGFDAIVDL